MVFFQILYYALGVVFTPNIVLTGPIALFGTLGSIGWVYNQFYEQFFPQYAIMNNNDIANTELDGLKILSSPIKEIIKIVVAGINVTVGR